MRKRKMKKRPVFVLLIVVIVVAVGFLYKQGQLKTQGNYYENISDFRVESDIGENDRSAAAQAYMESITYKIIDIDTDSLNATVEVSVPQVSEALVQTVAQVLRDYPDASSEQVKEYVLLDFQNRLENDELPRRTETLSVPVERTFFEYKLAPNSDWYQFTMGELEELYLEYFRVMIGGMTDEAPNN